MSDGDALRQAVLANPDEDTPRLIYADWLDENGQADRAAFIRHQIEAVRGDPFCGQVRAAAKRAGMLLEKYLTAWHAHIREVIQSQLEDFVSVQISNSQANPLRDVVKVRVRFERGFVGHLTLQPTVFARVASGIFNAEPIQSLELSRPTMLEAPDTARLHPLQPVFETPQLRHLRRLEFARLQGATEEEFAAMLECPHLTSLRDLSLRENVVPPSWLVDVFSGVRFPELQGLDISEIPNLGPGLVNAFSRANHREIRRLDVSGVVFNSDNLRQLLTSRCLRTVEELRLGCSGRSAGPLSHFNPGWVLPLERMVILDLSGQRLGNDGVGDILKQQQASALRYLGVAFNDLDSGVLRFFTESKHLSLNHVDVRGNNFTPSGIKALKDRFPDALIVV